MISEASKEQLRQYVLCSAWPQVTDLCRRLLVSHSDEGLYALLAKALVHQGQDTAAIEAYLEGLKLRDDRPESHYALAVLYKKQQRKALAVCHYRLALQCSPDWQKAALGLARLLYQLGDADQALGEYRKIIQQDPNCSEAHFAIGLLCEQKGEDLLAIKSYRQTIFVQPDHISAFRFLGAVLVRQGACDAAIDVYQQALTLCSDSADSDRAMLYGNLGQAYQANGESQQAIEAYQQALALDPTLAIAHRNLGHLSCAAQAMPQALTHFKAALRHAVGKNYLAAASDYAWTLASAGQWEDVLDCFATCLAPADDKTNASTDTNKNAAADFVLDYCQRVRSLPEDDLLFRLQRATGLFLETLLSAAPTERLKAQLALTYERLADLSLACDAPARAEQCYRLALSLAPNMWHLYQSLGDCLQVQGRYAGAIAIYQAGTLQSHLLLPSTLPLTQTTRSQVSLISHSTGISTVCEQQDAFILSETIPDNVEPFAPSDSLIDIATDIATDTAADTAVSAALFTLTKAQLKESIDKAISAQNAGPTVSVSGVYARAQDWLVESPCTETVPSETSHSETAHISTTQTLVQSPVQPLDVKPVDAACGGLTCQLCMTNLIRKFSPVQVADSAFRCEPFSATDNISFSLDHFAVTIPDGKAWIAPQKDAWAVCNEIAIFSPDNFLLSNLSRCYPWYLPGCQRHDVASHSIFQRQQPLPPIQKLSGRVAVLSGLSGHIYYHWLFDVLPRFRVLYEAFKAEKRSLKDIDYFVVNSVKKPFQQETLQRLGIPLEKVIESDRVPHFQADELVVPSFAGPLDWVPPSSMAFLRNAFLNRAGLRRDQNLAETVKVFGKRIYISRAKAKYRHVFNEDAVIDLLERFGFVTVALETLSVVAQARLFSEAEVVVAAHGSGLANLVFCSPNTQVIEFFSPNYLRTDYWMISEYLQLQHYYMIGESFELHPLRQLMYPSGLTEDFSINLTALRSLLTQMQIEPLSL